MMQSAKKLPKQISRPLAAATDQGLVASLVAAGRETPLSRVSVVSKREVTAFAPADANTAVSPLQPVTLKITGPKFRGTKMLRAIVKDRQKNAQSIEYHFRLTDDFPFPVSMRPQADGDANRRSAFRVAPDEASPISVSLQWQNRLAHSRMSDISITGMGLIVKPESAQILEHAEHLHLHFKLPVSETDLKLVGTIPYGRPQDGLIHCGIRFDWDQTLSFYRQEAAISAYVLKRQKEMIQVRGGKFFPVKKEHIYILTQIPLYYQPEDNRYALYKPPQGSISHVRLANGLTPKLYIHHDDRCSLIEVLEQHFEKKLANASTTELLLEARAALYHLATEAFAVPCETVYTILYKAVDFLVHTAMKTPDMIERMIFTASTEHNTVVHSLNVMLFTLNFCRFSQYPQDTLKHYALSALLHDLGKTQLPPRLQTVSHHLSPEEFEIHKSHPQNGYALLNEAENLDEDIALGALQHHEKLDGSGYPHATTRISFIGQLLAIVDAFEALTNTSHAERRAKAPIDTLAKLKEEARQGKINRRLFEKFCYSLT